MTREELCVQACNGVTDDQMRDLSVLDLINSTNSVLVHTDELRTAVEPVRRLLSATTLELFALLDAYKAAVEARVELESRIARTDEMLAESGMGVDHAIREFLNTPGGK